MKKKRKSREEDIEYIVPIGITVIDENGEEVHVLDEKTGMEAMIRYFTGEEPALVSVYKDDVLLRRQWQMVDGTKKEEPK